MLFDTSPRTLGLTRQQWFVLALLTFFVGLSIQYSLKTTRSAIVRWHNQLDRMNDGENIYESYNYPNPPIMALFLKPLIHLSPNAAALTWFYVKVAMTLLAFLWVFRLVEASGQPFPRWAKALTVLLSLRPIMGDLQHGNVNLFILFLVVGALYAFHQQRDVLSGVVIGLAIACKVTPALFLPYFVWKRAWRALIGSVMGLVLFFFVVPSCFLGWQENATQLQSWFERMVQPFVAGGFVTTEHNNQSLPGVVYRLTTHSPSFSTFVNDGVKDVYTPTDYHNLLDLKTGTARWIVKGCMGLFALLVVWSCRTPIRQRDGWRLAAEFSIVVLGMLLFSERTWKHHCVTLLLPFAVLCYHLAVCRPSRGMSVFLIATLTAVTLLMASTSTSLFGWDNVAKLAQVYGAYVWSYMLLLAALVAVLRRSDPAAAVGLVTRPTAPPPLAACATAPAA
jgi:alpha-1,2-mannosyltransferase